MVFVLIKEVSSYPQRRIIIETRLVSKIDFLFGFATGGRWVPVGVHSVPASGSTGVDWYQNLPLGPIFTNEDPPFNFNQHSIQRRFALSIFYSFPSHPLSFKQQQNILCYFTFAIDFNHCQDTKSKEIMTS